MQEATEPHFFEVLSWAAQAGLFLIAATAVFVARKEIQTVITHNRASIILEIDKRWESAEIIESRTYLTDIWSDVRASRPPEEWDDEFKTTMDKAKRDDPKRYRTLMRLAGHYETVGWAIKKQYVVCDDFLDLFGESVRIFGDVFEGHLRGLQSTESKPHLYEYALSLVDEARAR